jgi:predicted MFS family arabinose efflux permease
MSNSIVAMYSQDYIGASLVEIGFIVSAFFFTGASLKLLIGLFLPITQMKIALVSSILIITISFFGYALVNTITSMILIRTLHGFGETLFAISALTFSSSISSTVSREEAIGKYTLTYAFGMMTGPAISTLSVVAFGMRGTFFFASTLAFLGVACAIVLVRKAPFDSTDFSNKKQDFTTVSRALSNRVFRSSLFAYFAISFAYAIMLTYVPIYVREKFNFTSEQVTLLFFAYYLVMFIVRFIIGRLLKLLEKGRILMLGLLNAVCMLWLMSISPPIFFTIAFSLQGLSMAVIFPTGAMRIADTVNQSELVLANSFYMLGWDLGFIISPNLLSLIVASFGVPYALAIAALLPLAAIVIMSDT